MAPETNPSQVIEDDGVVPVLQTTEEDPTIMPVIEDDGVVPVLQTTEEDPTIMPVIEDDVPCIINLSLTQAEIDVLAGDVDVHPIEENEVALTVPCNLMSEEYVVQSIANLQLPKLQKLHVRKPKKPGCLSGVEALKMFTEEADEKERKECEKEEKKQEQLRKKEEREKKAEEAKEMRKKHEEEKKKKEEQAKKKKNNDEGTTLEEMEAQAKIMKMQMAKF